MHPKIEELTIMGIKFPALSCLLVLVTTSFVLSSVAKAETPDYQTTDMLLKELILAMILLFTEIPV